MGGNLGSCIDARLTKNCGWDIKISKLGRDANRDKNRHNFDESSRKDAARMIVHRSGWANKNQEPKQFRHLITHSVENSALMLLSWSKTDKSVRKRFTFLEKHLFKQKLGYHSFDITRPWNAAWKVPLQFDQEKGNCCRNKLEKQKQVIFDAQSHQTDYYNS